MKFLSKIGKKRNVITIVMASSLKSKKESALDIFEDISGLDKPFNRSKAIISRSLFSAGLEKLRMAGKHSNMKMRGIRGRMANATENSKNPVLYFFVPACYRADEAAIFIAETFPLLLDSIVGFSHFYTKEVYYDKCNFKDSDYPITIKLEMECFCDSMESRAIFNTAAGLFVDHFKKGIEWQDYAGKREFTIDLYIPEVEGISESCNEKECKTFAIFSINLKKSHCPISRLQTAEYVLIKLKNFLIKEAPGISYKANCIITGRDIANNQAHTEISTDNLKFDL